MSPETNSIAANLIVSQNSLSSDDENKLYSDVRKFIKHYKKASNAAEGSTHDANANVTNKNIATMEAEMFKKYKIGINREMMYDVIKERFDNKTAKEYLSQLQKHTIYKHDETSLFPYCVSISMYPFMLNGLVPLGGESSPPKHLYSYCGSSVNLVFAIAAQFAGAVATAEFLPALDYFAKKDYGRDYLDTPEGRHIINNAFQNVVYCLNQPAAARGFQSVFWNLSLFDKEFLKSMFEDYVYPDGSKMDFENVDKLQRYFLEWFQNERKIKDLTFPVITVSIVTETIIDNIQYTSGEDKTIYSHGNPHPDHHEAIIKKLKKDKVLMKHGDPIKNFEEANSPVVNITAIGDEMTFKTDWISIPEPGNPAYHAIFKIKKLEYRTEIKDKEFAWWVADRMTDGDDFFIYMGPPSALSSCCRLRNEVEENTFSYSLGAGGVQTGSISVMTLNLPQFMQDTYKEADEKLPRNKHSEIERYHYVLEKLREQVQKMHKWQISFKDIIQDYKENGLLPVYDAGFITLEKQFLTIGLTGFPEAYHAIYNGPARNTNHYKNWCAGILKTIKEENTKARSLYGQRFNTEVVPGENASIKLANWDTEAGYNKYREYTSYFYLPSDEEVSIVDKFEMHGEEITGYCDGGTALHLNLQEPIPTKDAGMHIMELAAETGVPYWTWNVRRTICNKCNRHFNRTYEKCPNCGSEDIDYATRVIGYLKRIRNFSEGRQTEESTRIYHS